MHLLPFALTFTPVGYVCRCTSMYVDVDHSRLVRSSIGIPRFPNLRCTWEFVERAANREGSTIMICYSHRTPASTIQFQCTLTTLSAHVHFIMDRSSNGRHPPPWSQLPCHWPMSLSHPLSPHSPYLRSTATSSCGLLDDG